MKNLICVLICVSGLSGCSSPVTSNPSGLSADRLKELQEKDELVLSNLDEEPLRQGTMKKESEGRITTEIWTWKEDHGSPFEKTETLIFKDGKLVSQTLKDPESGVTWSRQFRQGKVFQINEERKDRGESVYLENGKIVGRTVSGKKPECVLYDGTAPRSASLETCEKKFNTAP